jgi:hypothetical protein
VVTNDEWVVEVVLAVLENQMSFEELVEEFELWLSPLP